MSDDVKKEFEQIRQVIADGNQQAAIAMLICRCNVDDPFYDSLILLETRLSNLKQSIIEGVISREDENIERNGISKGILSLLKTLEITIIQQLKVVEPLPAGQVAAPGKPDLPIVKATEKPPVYNTRGLHARKWMLAAGLLLTVMIVWTFGRLVFNRPAFAGPATHDLVLSLTVLPADVPIGPLGRAQIEVGTFISGLTNKSPDGTFFFKNVPVKKGEDSLILRLPDLKYKYNVVRYGAATESVSSFHILLKTNTFAGKLLRPNLQPAPGVDIEIERGLAHAITDAQGNFSFTLPDWGAITVQLVMRQRGKVLVDRKVALNAAVFQELKTPD